MVISQIGRQYSAIRLGSNIDPAFYCAVGTGSQSNNGSQYTLVAEKNRAYLTSNDFSTNQKMTTISDFSSTTMSGIALREFGWINTATSGTGSLWNYECFANSITFDGTNDLRVQQTWRVW